MKIKIVKEVLCNNEIGIKLKIVIVSIFILIGFKLLMSEVNMDEETEKKLNEIFHSIKLEYDLS